MHDASHGVGKMLKFGPLVLVAHIMDSIAVQKVKRGIYTRLEIGGRVRKRDGEVIQDIDLTEVSLVARRPSSRFPEIKAVK
jgi:hypothetical protein